MSEYKEIKGKTVLNVGTDPSDTGAEGQVWYNSTAGAFKSIISSEAWSSGANLITGRVNIGSSGTQTAGLAWCGDPGSAHNLSNSTEEYNGSGWSSGGNFPISTRRILGAGGDTGSIIALSEEYDGTSWTAGNPINTARKDFNGAGTLTAGIIFGGNPTTGATEQYDGTNWTTSPASLATARRFGAGAGTGSLALLAGGQTTASTEEFTEAFNATKNFTTS